MKKAETPIAIIALLVAIGLGLATLWWLITLWRGFSALWAWLPPPVQVAAVGMLTTLIVKSVDSLASETSLPAVVYQRRYELYSTIVDALGQLSAKRKDVAIRQVLVDHARQLAMIGGTQVLSLLGPRGGATDFAFGEAELLMAFRSDLGVTGPLEGAEALQRCLTDADGDGRPS